MKPPTLTPLLFDTSHEWQVLYNRLNSYCRWAIVGGAVRDYLLKKIPRDIDIVVDCGVVELDRLLSGFSVQTNRYGGRIANLSRRLKVDIWPIRTTWAFQNGLVDPGHDPFESFKYCTFLNIDSAMAIFPEGRLDASGFAASLALGQLELVLRSNPAPYAAAARALALSQKYRLGLSADLYEYINFVASEYPDAFEAYGIRRYKKRHFRQISTSTYVIPNLAYTHTTSAKILRQKVGSSRSSHAEYDINVHTLSLDSHQIPQADSIEKLTALVTNSIRNHSSRLSNTTNSNRQFNLYLNASEILGLTDTDGRLLPSSYQLALTPPHKVSTFLSDRFSCSIVGKQWTRWAGFSDFQNVDPASAFQFLSCVSNLSQTTIRRRSSTLERWNKFFQTPYHPALSFR